MGDYGWSILLNFGTSQGSVAVEYGRVLEYPYFFAILQLYNPQAPTPQQNLLFYHPVSGGT